MSAFNAGVILVDIVEPRREKRRRAKRFWSQTRNVLKTVNLLFFFSEKKKDVWTAPTSVYEPSGAIVGGPHNYEGQFVNRVFKFDVILVLLIFWFRL